MGKAYGAASESLLAEFELRSGITLPDQYKSFFRQQNGGRPDLGEFIVPGWGDSIANSFYGVGIGGSSDIERCIESFRDVIPSYMIPIGNDPAGNQICIGIEGAWLGRIYFWDHGDWDNDDNPSTPIEVSPSLENFFEACKI
jgi:hypothetical protein